MRVRRVYDPPDPADGHRVLVDRLWPRGLAKTAAALPPRLVIGKSITANTAGPPGEPDGTGPAGKPGGWRPN